MKWAKLVLLGALPVLVAAFWLRARLVDQTEAVRTFCRATRGGEPWANVERRAEALELTFVRANASTEPREEYLTWVDSLGYRLGCTVVVERGRVVTTRDGELPSK